MHDKLKIGAKQDASVRYASTEVRNEDDGLALVHHATSDAFEVKAMAPFSHFGTRSAAKSRVHDRGDARLISAHLDIRNPLYLSDVNDLHGLETYLSLISASEAKEALGPQIDKIRDVAELKGEGEAFELLAEKLIDAGWDGIGYRNHHEDPGSMSWVILDPCQVMLIKDGPCRENLDAWEMSQDDFIGPAIVMEHFEIDGGEYAYFHIWESMHENRESYPLLARDKDGWEVRWFDDWDTVGNVCLFDPNGVGAGFYLEGQAWINEPDRGKGRAAMMINAAADLMGGSPTANLYGTGFSPAGYAAHAAAHRIACENARENGYEPLCDRDLEDLEP